MAGPHTPHEILQQSELIYSEASISEAVDRLARDNGSSFRY